VPCRLITHGQLIAHALSAINKKGKNSGGSLHRELLEGARFRDVPVMKTRQNSGETKVITFSDDSIHFQRFLSLALFSDCLCTIQKKYRSNPNIHNINCIRTAEENLQKVSKQPKPTL